MLILVCYFTIASVLLGRMPRHGMTPSRLFTWVLLGSCVLSVLPVLSYPVQPGPEVIALVVASHALFVVGNIVGRRGGERFESTTLVRNSRFIMPLAIAFAGLTIAINLATGSIPVLTPLTQIGALRREFLSSGFALGQLASVERALAYGAIAYAPLLPYFLQQRRRVEAAVAVISLVLVADSQFRLGGRADVAWMLSSTGFIYMVVRQQNKGRSSTSSRQRTKQIRTLTLFGTGAAILFFVFGGYFYTQRTSGFVGNEDFFLSRNCAGAEFGVSTQNATASVKSLALSSCYFSSPLHTMQIQLDGFDEQYGRSWGTYNSGLLFREDFRETRADIASYFSDRGLATNPWVSSFRDFWLDLGMSAPLAFLPLGYFITRGMTGPVRTESRLSRRALLFTWVLMLPFQSPLYLTSLVYPLIVTFIADWLARYRQTGRVSDTWIRAGSSPEPQNK